jgi:hypothetical protein
VALCPWPGWTWTAWRGAASQFRDKPMTAPDVTSRLPFIVAALRPRYKTSALLLRWIRSSDRIL